MEGPELPETIPLFLQERYAGNGHYPVADAAFVDMLLVWLETDEQQARPRLIFHPMVLRRLGEIERTDSALYYEVLSRFRGLRITPYDVVQAIHALPIPHSTRPLPQSSVELMGMHFEPPKMFVEYLLPHGMTILAGKRKKGKSTMCLDLALSIASGRQVFGHLRTRQSKVLYVSLEDNAELLHERLRKIQPNFQGHPNLTFLYEFSHLDEEALGWLKDYISEGFEVLIIDVLGRISPVGGKVRQSYDEYTLMTSVLGPIQQLANAARVAIIFLDHVRKAEADDIFDTIIGSSAKWGVADHGLIYERRFQETDAVIYSSSRRLGDDVMRVMLIDGHLEFLGRGEEYDRNREDLQIMKILEDENAPMGLPELMKTLGLTQGHYGRFKKVLSRLYTDGIVGKTKQGRYTIGLRDVPF